MLLNLFSGLVGTTVAAETSAKEKLRILANSVKEELGRLEALFNMAEDDALIDTVIYQQNSLLAYQQYLFQLMRENAPEEPEGFMLEAIQPRTTSEEGLSMG